MVFNRKQDRLNNFDYNFKLCLQNEIKSKSYVNNEFGVSRMSDAGQMFNFACTHIIFKYYLENNNMKVCELQVIVNDLYNSFVNDVTTKNVIQ